MVAGKTCEEVSAELQKLAKEYYDDADVSLRVAAFATKHVYIFGEVSTPGHLPLQRRQHHLDLLARAQPTRLAEFNRIQVLHAPPRMASWWLKRMLTIDFDQMIQKGDTRLDAVLEEGDAAFLWSPPNVLATVG